VPYDSWIVGSATDWFAPSPQAGGVQVIWKNSSGTLIAIPVTGLDGSFGERDINALCVGDDGTLYYSVVPTHAQGGAIYRVGITWNGGTNPPTASFSGTPSRLRVGSASIFDVPQGLAVVNGGPHDGVWYVTMGGTLGRISKTTVDQLAPAESRSAPFLSMSLCTNGRLMFVGTSWLSAGSRDVVAVDVETMAAATTLCSIAPTGGTVALVQMSMDQASKVVCVDDQGRAYRVDPLAGTYTQLSLQHYQSVGNGGAVNPWNGELAIVPGTLTAQRFVERWDFVASSATVGVGSSTPTALVPFVPSSYEIFGLECALDSTSPAHLPRIGYGSIMPKQATSGVVNVTVTLRNAIPSSFAFVWVGLSRTQWGTQTLPLDGTLFGAPGCFARVSQDAAVYVSVDASGGASYQIGLPASPPSYAGLDLFVQWFPYATSNSFGFGTSDALRLHVR
jgi:hypothetical protein